VFECTEIPREPAVPRIQGTVTIKGHSDATIVRPSAKSRKAKALAFAKEGLSRGSASGEHLYRQVAQNIGQQIRAGKLKPGERLPSMDDLAEVYGVTKITVRRALLELKSEGLLYTRPAQGTYVAESLPPDKIRHKSQVLTVGVVSHVLLPENPGPYHSEILASLRMEMSRLRGNLVVLPRPDVSVDDISEQMRHSNLDAVVYLGAFENDLLRRLVRNGPPAVLVDFQGRGLHVDTITVDNVLGGEQAIDHLVSLGHKDIAIMLGDDRGNVTKDRLAGAHAALERAGIAASSVRTAYGDFMMESGVAAMSELLGANPLPTAVFCMNDEMAVGAIQTIHRQSALEVPRDISIIGFDDIIWSTATHPRLTTVRVDKKLMGRLAMKRVMSVLEDGPHTVTSTTIATELVLRESTARPPDRSHPVGS
jgi:DNA-binding LacI/PurR family transcriptional regulator